MYEYEITTLLFPPYWLVDSDQGLDQKPLCSVFSLYNTVITAVTYGYSIIDVSLRS